MSGGGSGNNITSIYEKSQPTVYFNKWQNLSGVDIDKTVGVWHSNNCMKSPASDELPVNTNSTTQDWQVGRTVQTFYDTDISVSLYPKFSNSKFLVIASVQGYWETVGGGGFGLGISRTYGPTRTLIRGIDGSAGNTWMDGLNGSGMANSSFSAKRIALDTPSYIVGGLITYKIAVGWWAASGRLFFGGTRSPAGQFYLNNHTNITVLEIES